MNDSTLNIIVKLVDDASSQLAALAAKVQGVGEVVGAAAKTMGDKMSAVGEKMVTMGEDVQRAGQKMSIGLTVPIVALGTIAAKSADDFETAMLKIQTGAGASSDEVAKFSDTFIKMSESGAQQTPLQLADGMFYVESAGYRAGDAMNVLKAAMDGANVSGVDLNTVSQQLVTVMNATKTPAAEAENTMALLNATVGQGVMKMEDLIGAMSTGIIPKAQVVGVGIKDVAATLDAFTASGTPATDAATRMGMALELAASPSKQGIDQLKAMGMTQYQLADDMRNQGLIPALEDLKAHLDKLTPDEQTTALKDLFGGARTAGGAAQMLQNLDKIKTAYDGLDKGVQQFSGYVQAQGETTEAYFNRMKAAASASSIQIGNAMAPLEAEIFPKLAKAIEAVANWFTKLSPGVQTAIIAGLGLVAVLGPLLVIVGSMITAVGTITTVIGGLIEVVGTVTTVFTTFGIEGLIVFAPITVAIIAFAALAFLVWKNWDTFKAAFLIIVGAIKTAWSDMVDGISNGMLAFAGVWQNIWDGLVGWFAAHVVKPIKDGIQAVIDAFNAMVSIVSTPVKIVTSAVSAVGSAISGFVNPNANMFSSVTTAAHHEAGGFVNAPRGTAVPIIAHGGEEVIPAEQVGSSRGGSTVVVNIVQPTVRRNSDLDDMRKMIEQVLRPVLLNAKVIHI